MTINYTPLLSLAEPVTGTQSGTWGDDVNQGLTDYLDIAIAGAQVISGSQTAVTLSKTTGSASASNIAQVGGAGTTGSSQYAVINCTGNPAGTLTVTVPNTSKTYLVINATSTSQSVVVKAAATTGVTIASGATALVAWNGSDFVVIGSTTAGALEVSGLFTAKSAVVQKSSAVGASNIDLSLGNVFSKTISTTTTFTVSNVPASGSVASFILDLTNGGSATVNWWSGVKWSYGLAPGLTTSGRDVLGFFTYDGGSTWNGFLLGSDMK
jgi:hypothetical protein